jgi:hypothetical protein
MAVTIQRFIVVCWPLRVRSLCTGSRTVGFGVVLSIFSFLINIPRIFEHKSVLVPTEDESLLYEVHLTKFGKDPRYKRWYLFSAWFLLRFIIPFGLLLYMNGAICYKVCKSSAAVVTIE